MATIAILALFVLALLTVWEAWYERAIPWHCGKYFLFLLALLIFVWLS